METTFSTFCHAIEASPLKYIKGECRLTHLTTDEWSTCLEDENFFDECSTENRTLHFAHKGLFLGDLIVEKQFIRTATTNKKGNNLSMALVINKDDACLVIIIKCKNKFPGCYEFGKFVAYIMTT